MSSASDIRRDLARHEQDGPHAPAPWVKQMVSHKTRHQEDDPHGLVPWVKQMVSWQETAQATTQQQLRYLW
jgi:hypothetical protein